MTLTTIDTSLESTQLLIQSIQQNPELALAAFAVGIGKLIKKSNLPNEFIPVAVILLTGAMGFLIKDRSLGAFLDGIVYGGLVVATHQSFKQLGKRPTRKKRRKAAEPGSRASGRKP